MGSGLNPTSAWEPRTWECGGCGHDPPLSSQDCTSNDAVVVLRQSYGTASSRAQQPCCFALYSFFNSMLSLGYSALYALSATAHSALQSPEVASVQRAPGLCQAWQPVPSHLRWFPCRTGGRRQCLCLFHLVMSVRSYSTQIRALKVPPRSRRPVHWMGDTQGMNAIPSLLLPPHGTGPPLVSFFFFPYSFSPTNL